MGAEIFDIKRQEGEDRREANGGADLRDKHDPQSALPGFAEVDKVG